MIYNMEYAQNVVEKTLGLSHPCAHGSWNPFFWCGDTCSPSWKLTYPNYGRGQSSSQIFPATFKRDMLVPWGVLLII